MFNVPVDIKAGGSFVLLNLILHSPNIQKWHKANQMDFVSFMLYIIFFYSVNRHHLLAQKKKKRKKQQQNMYWWDDR